MTRAEEFVYKAVEAGWLEIDSQGRVWRTGRQQTSRWGGGTRVVACQRERAEYKASNGYFQVRVMFDGVRGLALAHRLVWFHFNGRIPNKLTINHKDGKRTNNDPSNLELATAKEQMQHAIRVLGHKPFEGVRFSDGVPGERNGMSKLNKKSVRAILRSNKKGIELSRLYGVAPATISRVRNGALWRHVRCE